MIGTAWHSWSYEYYWMARGRVNGPLLRQPAYLHPPPNTGNLLWLSLILCPHPTLKKKKKPSLSFCFLSHPLCLSLPLSLHLFLSLRSGISFSLSLCFHLKQELLFYFGWVFCWWVLFYCWVFFFFFGWLVCFLPGCLWDHSSRTRDWTWALGSESVES